ncbi:glycerol-3-phosphate dehydrogenase/oxidase [Spiractinospora alimapuensis]|uniref:glycerol-3-phosphate dehydrogenase/oxidase n=1 Tax=Spiractinospora alimapuensis TaxID=2820884 RepID=UPI001F4900C9|nr:glycerol-3-phosphate dehydrogenase/oxidase [Spiractinospora alimapuensis]QVQ51760.1 glycerol-3-phosphate dehydrogenase/oxidase [Spiractinospora alimapuensis]
MSIRGRSPVGGGGPLSATDRARLGAQQRRRAWERLSRDEFDLVVVGGGVTGAGTALDAVTRGLSVALVEAGDFASGTSSRSGKVFHGGLRYLEQLNFSLVREALTERDLMVDRLCPHLVSPEPFLFPLAHHWERPYLGAGVLLYDLLRLGGPRSVPNHRHLSQRQTLRAAPGLRSDAVAGGVRYYDVRVDDARHTLTVVRTAARLGAEVISRVSAVAIPRDGGRVRGVRVRDGETGAETTVRARAVVNATGVWAADVQGLAAPPTVSITAAKGIHLVLPRDRINANTGLITRTADSVFIVRRWFDHWLMGTTDTPWTGDRAEPVATDEDVDYLLTQANRLLARPLARSDLVGVYAGLRPLVSGASHDTAGLSRDHTVVGGPDGLVTVVGGKYTTYRLMARDAVDAATRWLPRAVPGSITHRQPLTGADGFHTLMRQRDSLATEAGLSTRWLRHLLGRYGGHTTELLDLIADRPELGEPLPGIAYLGAEFVYAARHEGALHLDDLLTRRTRAFMESADQGRSAAPVAVRLVAPELGWDEERCAEEVRTYIASSAVDWTRSIR